MSRWYRIDKEQEGYNNYNRPGYSRYDDGHEYEQGWDDHAREERLERERRKEQQEIEETEERRIERKHYEELQREQEVEF
jgi:hypothetical protein